MAIYADKESILALRAPGSIATRVIEAFQKTYGEERSKRLRSDGIAQCIDLATSDKFRDLGKDPWTESRPEAAAPPLRDCSQVKFMIIGAGFGSRSLAHILSRQAWIPVKFLLSTS